MSTSTREEFQFLYDEGDQLEFMNQASFEQVTLPKAMVGEPARFLKEGMTVNVKSHEGRPLSVDLPRAWRSRWSRPTLCQGADRRLLLQARHLENGGGSWSRPTSRPAPASSS